VFFHEKQIKNVKKYFLDEKKFTFFSILATQKKADLCADADYDQITEPYGLLIAGQLSGKASLGCRAGNRTRACHTASRRTTI
jgi:hypothetical protein